MAVDVRCDRVSKRYRIRRRSSPARRGLANIAAQAFWRGTEDFWALRDVSFDIARGETLGVIGRNGAGKSTVLKLLGGITDPTSGEITIVGRLAALIEVGSGFHPELTGRENVFLSGAILGMRRREIKARLDSITDFSGVAAFIDTPVKYYSSGMYVRLGFAVAAHLEPDVLLVDEILAVGDAEFQGRCLQRIQELKRRGTTMVLVSHDLGAVEQLSDRAVLLDGGRVTADGRPEEVVSAYQRMVSGPDTLTEQDEAAPPDDSVRITGLTLHGEDGTAIIAARSGAPLTIRMLLQGRLVNPLTVTLTFYDFHTGLLLTQCDAEIPGTEHDGIPDVLVEFVLPELLLAPGAYTLGATVKPVAAPRAVAWRFGRTTLYVQGDATGRGVFGQPFQCRVLRSTDVHDRGAISPVSPASAAR